VLLASFTRRFEQKYAIGAYACSLSCSLSQFLKGDHISWCCTTSAVAYLTCWRRYVHHGG
jgi:hypothetical protein